jgi:hypothetical protein
MGYNNMPFGQPTPGRPIGRPGVSRPQGVFCQFLFCPNSSRFRPTEARRREAEKIIIQFANTKGFSMY